MLSPEAPDKLKALFFSGAKDERSHLKRGGFSGFSDTPIGKAPGVGYFKGTGISSRSGKVTGRGYRAWWPKGWRYRWINPWNGPSGSFSGTLNLVWNFGQLYREYQGL